MSYKSQGHEIYFRHKEGNRKHQDKGIEQQLKNGKDLSSESILTRLKQARMEDSIRKPITTYYST